MKTSLALLSTLLLLGLSSSGMAWDWNLNNIASFNTEITYPYMVHCLGAVKAANFGAAMGACTAAPTLDQTTWLLNNIANPTCDMFTKFTQLIVQHETCLADVCLTTNSDATVDEGRIAWIFAGTALEDVTDDIKGQVNDCAAEVDDFMEDNESDIVTAWTNGANACDLPVPSNAATLVKRVAISNCVKRAFVNECEAIMPASRECDGTCYYGR